MRYCMGALDPSFWRPTDEPTRFDHGCCRQGGGPGRQTGIVAGIVKVGFVGLGSSGLSLTGQVSHPVCDEVM